MINLNRLKPIWLVRNETVIDELKKACNLVYAWYDQLSTHQDSSSIYYRVKAATSGGCFEFATWSVSDADDLITALCRESKIKWSSIDTHWDVQKSYIPALTNFMRLVCVVMWARRVMVAPLFFPAPNKVDGVLDQICSLFSHVSTLSVVRSLHAGSQIEGVVYPYDDNGRRATIWARILLSTTLYSVDDFDSETVPELLFNSYGKRDSVLRGCDALAFVKTIYRDNAAANEYLNNYDAKVVHERTERLNKSRERRRERDAKRPRRDNKYSNKSYSDSIQVCQAYATCSDEETLGSIIKDHFIPIRYRRIFDLDSGYYDCLDPKVLNLVNIFSAQLEGFLIYKRYESPKLPNSNAPVLHSYISMYLPHFFMERDGNLDEYPTSLNEFSSFLYVTWDRQGTESTFNFGKKPPMTLLAYLEMHVSIHGYSNDTHYQKVKSFDLYFSYIYEHRQHIRLADNFKNLISASCYPRVARSFGTSKKSLPRKYFGAFVSMLYSFEYLVTHLNSMAEGETFGVENGELVLPSESDLRYKEHWAGIWGSGVGVRAVDQSVLNYCPIFYSDSKIYRLEYIPRFYNPSEYEIWVADPALKSTVDPKKKNSVRQKVERIAPNDVRVTQVMCETGFRQLHTIWLDLQRYDKRVVRSSESSLTVLQVATDKAHGAWTAIVARHVVDILDRQRAWYQKCSDPKYSEDVHYNGNSKSKFGSFKPLFRKYFGHPRSWSVYTKFPIFLAALKYFIERQIGDDTDYNLVNIKRDDDHFVEFDDYSAYPHNSFAWLDVCSEYTPHGLRAAFITEALNFLPPSIVGQYFTGQTPEQVLYYQIVDGVQIPGHRQILTEYLSRNLDAFSAAEAPDIAERIIKLNASLVRSIKENVSEAIQRFGLVSLQGIKRSTQKSSTNGLDLLIAQKFTELAYNTTHICPFANKCPVEIVKALGNTRPCAVCPYAIRGIMHLPAISAEKDKYKELMAGVSTKLKVYIGRDHKSRDLQEIENLNAEHDFYTREALALEAVEQQLYELHKSGNAQSFIVQGKEDLVCHFERIELDGGGALMKRLVDVLAWPNATSPDLDLRLANVRAKLLMHDGRPEELLKIPEGPPASQLFSVIKSMVDSGRLDVMDLIRLANAETPVGSPDERPDLIAQLNSRDEITQWPSGKTR